MFFVQQGDGRAQIKPARKVGVDVPCPVETIVVADQNPQVALRRRRGNLDGNVPDDALTAIGAQHGFDYDFVAGTSFGDVSTRGFEVSGTPVGNNVKLQFHPFDLGS